MELDFSRKKCFYFSKNNKGEICCIKSPYLSRIFHEIVHAVHYAENSVAYIIRKNNKSFSLYPNMGTEEELLTISGFSNAELLIIDWPQNITNFSIEDRYNERVKECYFDLCCENAFILSLKKDSSTLQLLAGYLTPPEALVSL